MTKFSNVIRLIAINKLTAQMIIIAFLCVFIFTGCHASNTHGSESESGQAPFIYGAGMMNAQTAGRNSAYAHDSVPKAYTFSQGDTVDVKFFYTPELNETQVVRPDGKIALQIIGEVTAAGKTPVQLRGLLKKLYTPHLKDPEISVVVRSFSDQRVFVGGQVMSPGTLEMAGQMTALEAIIQAGGINFKEAEVRSVVVIRHYDGTRYGYLLNMEPVLEGKESMPFFLEAKDIVYVPRTKIAKVNQWIDQYINRIVPQTGFTFTHRRGDTTVGIDTSIR